MSAQPAYRIEENERDRKWIVEFSQDVLSREQVSSFLDYLTLESIRDKSQLTPEDAVEIAGDIDSVVAARLRSRLMEG